MEKYHLPIYNDKVHSFIVIAENNFDATTWYLACKLYAIKIDLSFLKRLTYIEDA